MNRSLTMNQRTVSRKAIAGGAIVEMALFLPILLILLFGVIDFSRAIHFDNILTHISREGANLSARGSRTDPQFVISALTETSEPLQFQQDGMIYITQIRGLASGQGQIIGQSRSAQGQQSLASRLWTCPAWNDNDCQINGAGAIVNLGVPLGEGDVVHAVEAQYDYKMLLNFVTDTGPDLYAITVL